MRADLRRALLGGAAVAALAAAIAGGPRLLRRLPYFDVRAVEISGTRLMEPREVLRAAAIREGQSVWDDPRGWERSLETHPAIASARVTRRLPGTLRIRVEEKRAVALVDEAGLTLVTATGERLPIDPSRAAANLPIARGEAANEVLSEVERLASLDPGFLADVSEIRAGDPEGRSLVLRHGRADVVVPAGASAARLLELRAVLADLDRRTAPENARGRARVDLRFAEQVVVRLPPSVQMP